MNCPVDGATLAMSERSGVEIDYCPTCRGVWLDRGELDKIVERTEAELATPVPDRRWSDDDDDDDRYDRDRYEGDTYRGRRRKRSFLGDLFEFGD
jgi:uncharacterized protein